MGTSSFSPALIDLCVTCSFIRDAKIAASERVKSGVTGEQLWLKINEPTEKDKGKYTMDIFDGKDGVKRVFDLSGQGEWPLKSNKEDASGPINFGCFCAYVTADNNKWIYFPLQHGKQHLKNSKGSSK